MANPTVHLDAYKFVLGVGKKGMREYIECFFNSVEFRPAFAANGNNGFRHGMEPVRLILGALKREFHGEFFLKVEENSGKELWSTRLWWFFPVVKRYSLQNHLPVQTRPMLCYYHHQSSGRQIKEFKWPYEASLSKQR